MTSHTQKPITFYERPYAFDILLTNRLKLFTIGLNHHSSNGGIVSNIVLKRLEFFYPFIKIHGYDIYHLAVSYIFSRKNAGPMWPGEFRKYSFSWLPIVNKVITAINTVIGKIPCYGYINKRIKIILLKILIRYWSITGSRRHTTLITT